MKKLTLSLLLALGITGAYANNFYAGMGAGVGSKSNGAIEAWNAIAGYDIDIPNSQFFVDNELGYSQYTGTVIVDYVEVPALGYFRLSQQNNFNMSSGIGYHLNQFLTLKANIGGQYNHLGYGDTYYPELDEHSPIFFKTWTENYISPFLKLTGLVKMTEYVNLSLIYQYTIQPQSFQAINQNSKNPENVRVPSVGNNLVLLGLQYSF